ncbi:hypothetical protein [Granulosicoccus antarcticus]|uniref:hypothetical protein n=1 Tax=Granulosicoccus antarcticus TaxID=437505 RepID=UPI0012FD5148|nr:hypothetical protein [Granulosicoccus antarcticus]
MALTTRVLPRLAAEERLLMLWGDIARQDILALQPIAKPGNNTKLAMDRALAKSLLLKTENK